MNPIKIPSDLLQKIDEHFLKEYPSEGCGLLLGPENDPAVISKWISCVNAQDKYNMLDSASFPRTSKNAYFIEPMQLLKVQKEARSLSENLRVICHSHPNSDAVFSAEDEKMAAPDGEPAYPDVSYLVVSIKGGKIFERCLFSWDSSQSKFVRIKKI